MGITLKSFSNKNVSDYNKNYANRGRFLEEVINNTNLYYLKNDVCVVHKKPTPIKILRVDGSRVEGFLEKQSTTDYNGCLSGRYIDFEAKQSASLTSFNLNNISDHQLKHCADVIRHNGICFFIIYFSKINKFYLLDAKIILNFISKNKKSIKIIDIQKLG